MIYFLYGENNFSLQSEVDRIVGGAEKSVEKIDAATLQGADVSDLLHGQTLFNDERCIVLRNTSENSLVWERLATELALMSDDRTIILVETKPDKRTKSYKDIVKLANVKEFPRWTQKDQAMILRWMNDEAQRLEMSMTDAQMRHLLQRVGYDQWRLFHALEKLSLAGDSTNDGIDRVIEAHPNENIFSLLDTALRGDANGIHTMLTGLKQTADPYQVAGLLFSQIMQLSTLAVASKPSQDVAKDIGAHPFVLSKLSSHATRMTLSDAKSYVRAAAQTDMQMKSSGVDPWLLIEQLLTKIAR